jgi:MYXO-CTERM domain-containing protein
VQLDGSPLEGLDADQVQALAAEAFGSWQSARCPGGGTPSVQSQFQGFVSCDRRETVCGASKNVNVLMLHDQNWPYGAGQIGVTTPAAGSESGLIVDADVELNSQDLSLTTGPSDPGQTALKYVMAHELGHFLGLAHSDVDGALMSPGYRSLPPEADLLSADDVAAICAVYPPGQPLTCPAPSAAAYDACALAVGEKPPCTLPSVAQDSASGCSCRAVPRGRPPSLAFTAALLAWAALRRHVKRRRREPLGGVPTAHDCFNCAHASETSSRA